MASLMFPVAHAAPAKPAPRKTFAVPRPKRRRARYAPRVSSGFDLVSQERPASPVRLGGLDVSEGMAERVMRMPAGPATAVGLGSAHVQPEAAVSFEQALHQKRASGGEPLPKEVRTFMEARFGTDFVDVRLHRDPTADRLARAARARAFTLGRDVFFRHGEFAPTSYGGRRLIAHELAHVVQQGALRQPGRSSSSAIPQPANRVQRVVPTPPVPDDEKIIKAKAQIEAAKKLLGDKRLDAAARADLRAQIDEAEKAVAGYRRSLSSAGTPGALATTTTGISPLALVVGLFVLAAGFLFAQSAGQSAAQKAAGEELGRKLQALAFAVETAVLMTAAGNVVYGHIVEEARRLAVELGLAASGAAVTKEMLCKMLDQMASQTRRTDTEKWKKIVSTQKGLGCRRSRAGR